MKLQPLNKKQKQAQVKLGIMSPKNPGEKKIYSKNVKKNNRNLDRCPYWYTTMQKTLNEGICNYNWSTSMAKNIHMVNIAYIESLGCTVYMSFVWILVQTWKSPGTEKKWELSTGKSSCWLMDGFAMDLYCSETSVFLSRSSRGSV